jgi:transcriptional regulator with XRE-family HTH domain
MAEKKSGGRGYRGFNEDATTETIELAKYLRALVNLAGKAQRDLEVPTGYGKSSISQYLSGEALPSEAFVRKLVAYVTHPLQRQTCTNEALRLFAAPNAPSRHRSFPPRGPQRTRTHRARLWPASRPPPRTRPQKPKINSRRPTNATGN